METHFSAWEYAHLGCFSFKKAMKANKPFIVIFFILIASPFSYSQFVKMDNLNEFGKGNYFAHVRFPEDAKRLITDKIRLNGMKATKDLFHENSNLFFLGYFVNPLNSEFVYVINCLKTRNGYDIWFYYIENRYRFFYDVIDNGQRVSVVYDPAILENQMVSPTKN